jgi:class 3 adenylate cyclase/predicted ATPase
MTFAEVLTQTIALLERQGRISYRALKRQFALDEQYLADLKFELTDVLHLAVDHAGTMLVWIGASATSSAGEITAPTPAMGAERRQLTVMFCDLVDSTSLARQLDPEDLRDVVRALQQITTELVERFGGHVAQYLGDGVLVYFGFPQAHEDDPHRAVRAALAIVDAIGPLNARLAGHPRVCLALRISIHTGPVVVGQLGSGQHHEQLAVGDTPNVAAHVQTLAAPNTVLITAPTWRIVQGYFACDFMGAHLLKGATDPMPVYRVLRESGVESRLDIAAPGGLTPLVGRDAEVSRLLERWEQAKSGLGQVVLIKGEPGIGKSRLVELLRDHVSAEGFTRIAFRCSSYHTHSALYPTISHLQRLLHFDRDDTPDTRLNKLEQAVQSYDFAPARIVPLLAALLSVPLPEGRYPPLGLTPQQQRQETGAALTSWLLQDAARQPVLLVYEDLHWADPSTLELLGLLVEMAPTGRMLVLLTFRPEFDPPWVGPPHITHLTLGRFAGPQIEAMITQVIRGKSLPPEVVHQVMTKTDGIPLFIEELLKMILESGLLHEVDGRFVLTGPLPPLAIPSTLQDSLMARLDRLSTAREIAQLAAVLGREFSYEVLCAVAQLDTAALQQAIESLLETELLYQARRPELVYLFKHALIRDTAYASLLNSTRQRYHQRIAQVLEERFPETAETQPELVAHHYTEAGLNAHAVPYWQSAGQRAVERSAHIEAIAHLTKGLDLLARLPDTPERAQQELACQLSLGASLLAAKGHPAPELEHVYARARRLCQQMGETPQLLGALQGLFAFYLAKAEFQSTRELGEEILAREPKTNPDHFRLVAYRVLAATHFYLGEFTSARGQLERGIALYNRERHGSLAFQYGQDVGVYYRVYSAWTLWLLGHVDQALKPIEEGLALARGLSHPFSVAVTLGHAAVLHHFRREWKAARERAEEAIGLCTDQGFPFYLAMGNIIRGCALVAQARDEAGISQAHDGLNAWRQTGAVILVPTFLSLLAEAHALVGQPDAGLAALAEALALADTSGECWWSAELHRLRGELLVQRAGADMHHAEQSFRRALEIARRQQAGSLELRAAMSLGGLWYRQERRRDARCILADVYARSAEGFDTADIEQARALLAEWE